MTGVTWAIGLAIGVAVLCILVRRRRAPLYDNSAYGHWQREQSVLWHGQPVTVTFDYATYLREPVVKRVNVHTLQQSAMGERSIVGFCHDDQEDRTFKLAGLHGSVLTERTQTSQGPTECFEGLTASGGTKV